MCFRFCCLQVKECMVFCLFSRISLSLAGNSGRLTRVRHSSHKSSATHSLRCVQRFRVSNNGCQCLGFFKCAQIVTHEIAHGGCTDSERGCFES